MYEIVDPDKEGPDVLATANSIPELWNAVLEIACRNGWKTHRAKSISKGDFYLSPGEYGHVKGPSSSPANLSFFTLTLTPPPKDEWQEWRERRPKKPAFIQNLELYNKAIDKWLSEMPERG